MSIVISNTGDVKRYVSPSMEHLQGSKILAIASQVRRLVAQGKEVCNLTIGDFRPEQFPIPVELTNEIQQAYSAGETNYPPADGVSILKEAVSQMYRRQFGLEYGQGGVCVGSGARPPLYAS